MLFCSCCLHFFELQQRNCCKGKSSLCRSLNVINSCSWKLFINLKIKAGFIEKNVEIL